MSDKPTQSPDRAGLYVLGLLRGEDRRAFEIDMSADPVLAAEVAAWEQRFLPLSLAVPRIEPSREVWHAIEQVIATPPAAPVREVRRRSVWRDWLWDNLAVWRGIGVVGVAAAVALAVLLPRPVPGPSLFAVLSTKSGPVFTVAMHMNGALDIAAVGHTAPPQGKVWQLWAVGHDAKPVPIGFVNSGSTKLPPNDLPAHLRKVNTLVAATVEPPGGSPTGQPDLPIVFAGPLVPVPRADS